MAKIIWFLPNLSSIFTWLRIIQWPDNPTKTDSSDDYPSLMWPQVRTILKSQSSFVAGPVIISCDKRSQGILSHISQWKPGHAGQYMFNCLWTVFKQNKAHNYSFLTNTFNCYVQHTHNKWYFLSLITHLFLIITFFITYTSVNLIRMFSTIFFIRISLHITNIYLSEFCTLYKDQVYSEIHLVDGFGKVEIYYVNIFSSF